MPPDNGASWETIEFRDGRRYALGDEVVITLRGGDTYQGHLNMIQPEYIILTNTGHTPVVGFSTALGFTVDDIVGMEAV